jgi:hypothetical protein
MENDKNYLEIGLEDEKKLKTDEKSTISVD